ncbi:MAG: cysteine--tRNA ligase [Candidatus Doudnabacteria bacterium RIFCSPHIGHO2_01_FULL_43_23]|uniref:Cysteine--tRNA ligase n=1 Tax=Candidatus Doudnabacteria bacterium RIFCSPHIGHO2_01_FULL_43_23 TaxID=1817822 RepID=A0A1F5NVM1_9BACT|nr:MAG: cysteine--tRNA ligase [Candidatus Doudnabacteria bacterium RIFCSPHIGHO2_01_FULL_43_23]
MLKLYNTLTKKQEEFQPIKKGSVGFYACGPTVYNFVHIGNLRTYILSDVLRRTLGFLGYKVNFVMNITDVGHLTGDVDTGEDKLEKGATREGKTVWDIAKFYEKAFLKDAKSINIKSPTKLPRATDHIKEQIKLISDLKKKGFTYDTPEAVYFDISKFKDYTKLSGRNLEGELQGARAEVVKDQAKKNPADFALWFKRVGKFADHTMHWDSPWGDGFPGWHIECSAMSAKYLGQPFDIHAGAVDLIFPHHSNEISQSVSAYGKNLANFWIHGEHLLINSGRMGKSEGNFITLKDVAEKGFNPLAFRYLVLGAHYRAKLNFSWESLEGAQNSLDHLYDKIAELKGTPSIAMCADFAIAFEKEIENDLNMPRVLSLTWRLLKSDNADKLKLSTLAKFDEVLGLDLLKGAAKRKKIPASVKKLAQAREDFRKEKDFKKSDEIRKEIESKGFIVKDTSDGPLIRKK